MSMHQRNPLLGVGLPAAAAVSLALAACGGGGSEGRASESAAASTVQSTGASDPLAGEWRTQFTCDESVRAIRQRLSPKQIERKVGSWKHFLAGSNGWQAKPTDDDPCHGVTGAAALIARFAEGNLALCDADTGQCEVNATYQPIGEHSIRVNDEEGNLCPCPGEWKFEIDGSRLTFHVPPDPYIVGAWEAAPWVRGG